MSCNDSVSLAKLKQQAQRQMKNPLAWRALADACLDAGLSTEALAALEHLRRLLPRDWPAGFQLANLYYAEGRYAEALDLYLPLMEQQPHSAEVRNNLGLLLKHLGQYQVAEQCLLEAIDLKPDYLDALNNLGNLYRDLQRYPQAKLCFDAALQLAPDNAELLTNLGLMLKSQGDIKGAIEVYRHAATQGNAPSALAFNYAIALIQSGQYPSGFAWYEQRWQMPRLAARKQQYDAVMAPWQGEVLRGKTLLLWCEQGLGDMIQMARYLPLWKAEHPECRLLLCVDPSLERLFAALPGVDQLSTTRQPIPVADYHMSVMSFPFRLHTDLDSIPAAPYLQFDADWLAAWADALGPRGSRARVGLVWQSGQPGVGQQELDRQSRSLGADDLAGLLQIDSVEWVNLQVGGEALEPQLSSRLLTPAAPIGDFADSAALLSQLDMLVTVDTAAAHLAGALGVPTRVLMSAVGGNLFPAEGGAMPWYPSMRLLRQQTLHDWRPVFAELARELAALKPAG